jgi:hypothetical protein
VNPSRAHTNQTDYCYVCKQPITDITEAVVLFPFGRPSKNEPPNYYATVHKNVCDTRYCTRSMELVEFLALVGKPEPNAEAFLTEK